jgi:hypothetical protein
VPRALFIDDAEGLHPRLVPVPPLLIVGAVLSLIHVTILDVVEVLLQASLAVNVLVCERPHADGLVTDASVKVTVVGPQASVALAEPNAFVISDGAGLHPIL